MVGRDVLIGVALGAMGLLISRLTDLWAAHGAAMNFGDTSYLDGTRSAIGTVIAQIPSGIRDALQFFLMLFVLRALLRSQALAAAVFTAIMAAETYFRTAGAFVLPDTISAILVYALIAQRGG